MQPFALRFCITSLLLALPYAACADQPLSLANPDPAGCTAISQDAAIKVALGVDTQYPNISWRAVNPPTWDWSNRARVLFKITNSSSDTVPLNDRIDDGNDKDILQGETVIPPGNNEKFLVNLSGGPLPPGCAAATVFSASGHLNTHHITAFQLFEANLALPVDRTIQSVTLTGRSTAVLQPKSILHDESGPPFISPVFGDNMVLQRDIPDRIWGWTKPGNTVTLSMAGKSYVGEADASGKWMVTTKALAAGGPYTIHVESNGHDRATISNVLMGDVWICSGQSNAGMGISLVNNGTQEVASANYPSIRLYRVPAVYNNRPLRWPGDPGNPVDGHWQKCTPETVGLSGWGGFPAIAYFFGRHLHKSLNVPIGLVANAWGGMPIETFIGGDALKNMTEFRRQVEALASEPTKDRAAAAMSAGLAAWYKVHDPGTAASPSWTSAARDDSSWATLANDKWWAPAWNHDLTSVEGLIWYRTTFRAPASWNGHDLVLSLDTISDFNTVYVNGTEVGSSTRTSEPSKFKVPAAALVVGTNTIAIRTLTPRLGPGVYGSVDDLWVAPTDDTTNKVSLASSVWKYKVALDLKAAGIPPPVVVPTDSPSSPTMIYNGMVAPLTPLAIKGITWYQGESSTSNAARYKRTLPLLIGDWREKFKSGDVPFLVVQLSSVGKGTTNEWSTWWAQLKEAQLVTVQQVPNTGLVVTSDIGDPTDTHYKNKQDAGNRLALCALGVAYHRPGEYSGPIYCGMKVEGSSIRLSFTHGAGLKAKGGRLLDFTIAGPAKKFVPADAVIQGDTVVVSSLSVSHPVAVRYGWASYVEGNLYNAAGLPASSFRTDNFPYLPEMRF